MGVKLLQGNEGLLGRMSISSCTKSGGDDNPCIAGLQTQKNLVLGRDASSKKIGYWSQQYEKYNGTDSFQTISSKKHKDAEVSEPVHDRMIVETKLKTKSTDQVDTRPWKEKREKEEGET